VSTSSADADAFSALFDQHHRAIWSFVRRRVINAADADDVSADVFTVAWRRWGVVPAQNERRLWLFGIARNVLRNHHRSSVRQQRLASRLAVVCERDLLVEPVERSNELWLALAQLSEADRDLLIMRAWDQLPVTDIAVLLDCSPNAVSLRLHKARGRLAAELQRHQPHGDERTEKDPARDGDEVREPAAKGDRR